MKNKDFKRSRFLIRGQAITEFVVLLFVFLGIVFSMLLLLSVFTEYGWRVLSLVGLPYP